MGSRWAFAWLDYSETAKNPEKHGYITLEILKGYDVTEDILDAILAHPGHKERKNL